MILFSANKFIVTVKPFVLPVLVGVVCAVIGGVLLAVAIGQIKRQIKLYNSITLVELKDFKWHYYVFICLVAFLLFFVVTQMADTAAPELLRLIRLFKMKRWQSNLVLGSLVWLLLCVEAFLVTLARSRNAVVDKGIYAGLHYLDWYHVHDYVIDEEKGQVILSSDKATFATLRGTTPPMRVTAADIPKLKFILHKNKNKFSV